MDLNNLGSLGSLGVGDFVVSGRSKYSIELNGSSQYVQPTFTSGLPITDNTQFTVATWVKVDSTGGLGACMFSGGNSSNGLPLYMLRIGDTDRTKAFFQYRDDANTGLTQQTDSNSTWSTDTWFHLIFLEKDGEHEWYVNNTLEFTNTYTRNLPLTINRHAIGCLLRSSAGDYFKGKFYDTRLYDKNLSAAERTTVYNHGEISGSNLILKYDYDQNVNDLSGNGNNGTLVGSPSYSTDTP